MYFVCQLVSQVQSKTNFQRSVIWGQFTMLGAVNPDKPYMYPTLPLWGYFKPCIYIYIYITILKEVYSWIDAFTEHSTETLGFTDDSSTDLLNGQLATRPVRSFTNGFGTVGAGVDVLHPQCGTKEPNEWFHSVLSTTFLSIFGLEHQWWKAYIQFTSNINLMN